jgi:hypothetical protein
VTHLVAGPALCWNATDRRRAPLHRVLIVLTALIATVLLLKRRTQGQIPAQ